MAVDHISCPLIKMTYQFLPLEKLHTEVPETRKETVMVAVVILLEKRERERQD